MLLLLISRCLVIAVIAAVANPAIAADCRNFINASMGGEGGAELVFSDSNHFTEKMLGETLMDCATYEIPGANGGFIVPTNAIGMGAKSGWTRDD